VVAAALLLDAVSVAPLLADHVSSDAVDVVSTVLAVLVSTVPVPAADVVPEVALVEVAAVVLATWLVAARPPVMATKAPMLMAAARRRAWPAGWGRRRVR